MNEIEDYEEEPENPYLIKEEPENPYLIMDFWQFAIVSTLMVVFFTWSLLFCVIFYGLEETKFLCIALLHDAFKTFLAVLSVVLSLIIFIAIIVFVIYNT